MKILFTTMMLALITTSAEAEQLKPHVKVNSLLTPQFRDLVL